MSAEEPKTVAESETPTDPPPPEPTEAPKDVTEEKAVIPPAPPPEEKPDETKALAIVESILFFSSLFFLPFFFSQLFEVFSNSAWLVRKGRKFFCSYFCRCFVFVSFIRENSLNKLNRCIIFSSFPAFFSQEPDGITGKILLRFSFSFSICYY